MITGDTTDAELLAPVRLDKQALHLALAPDRRDDMSAVDIAKRVNDIAEEEGRTFARAALRDALRHGAQPEAVRAHLLRLLLAPADDTWSGRTNDVRRARFDGIRDEVGALLTGL